jgi:lipopolysaccharide export system permease protein
MNRIDRSILATYLRSYVIVLTAVLSLYVVIDLFTNLDDFVSKNGLVATLEHIGRYYGVRMVQIFDKLSEVIALLAGLFTISGMMRSNELIPQLSAGIPTRRIIRPVLIGAGIMLALGPLNQELLIPQFADELQVPRDDPNQERPTEMRGAYDSTGAHIEGIFGFRRERRIRSFFVTFPEDGAAGMIHLQAEEAIYIESDGVSPGGWLMYNVTPELAEPLPEQLESRGPRRYFLRVRDVDFDSLTRGSTLHSLASTARLHEVLQKPDQRRLASVAVLFHMRFTRPLVGVVLVLLGLSILLKDHNRHVLVSSAMCLLMCVIFYGVVLACKYLGEKDLISAPLAAWLPVIIFGPFALAQFDSMQT